MVAEAVEISRPPHRGPQAPPDRGASRRTDWLDGDPTRLAQVFANLLNNAAKYTRAGRAHHADGDGGGGEAVVRVRDTGRA